MKLNAERGERFLDREQCLRPQSFIERTLCFIITYYLCFIHQHDLTSVITCILPLHPANVFTLSCKSRLPCLPREAARRLPRLTHAVAGANCSRRDARVQFAPPEAAPPPGQRTGGFCQLVRAVGRLGSQRIVLTLWRGKMHRVGSTQLIQRNLARNESGLAQL